MKRSTIQRGCAKRAAMFPTGSVSREGGSGAARVSATRRKTALTNPAARESLSSFTSSTASFTAARSGTRG